MYTYKILSKIESPVSFWGFKGIHIGLFILLVCLSGLLLTFVSSFAMKSLIIILSFTIAIRLYYLSSEGVKIIHRKRGAKKQPKAIIIRKATFQQKYIIKKGS